jgi:hypothetical protein
MTIRSAALVLLAGLGPALGAQAATTLDVLATEPAGTELTLGSNETYYLHIGYSTDEPVSIWARPYFEGREVNAGSNPSRTYTGDGEALAWFFFLGEPGQQVDEIRISAGDGSRSGTEVLVTLPVRITAGARPAATSTEPAWLARLRAEDERRQREDYERRMSEPVGIGGSLFAVAFMLTMLAIGVGGIVLPIRSILRWDGAWRLAAVVPALVVGFVAIRIVVDTARDPTSHNLWPFEIIQAGFLSLVLIGAMAIARRFIGQRI